MNRPAAHGTVPNMRDVVEAFDWDANPLGPRASWPAELETAVQQVLDSGFPKALAWGPQLITIYNDAFRTILGGKPEALGRSFSEVWAEAWHEIGPIADLAMAGQSTFIENFPLVIDRSGTPEQAHFTFCYNPLRMKDGTVAGMLDTVIETTETVEAQAVLDIANHELAHRLKNTLAIVQSIASQTMRKSVDEDVYRAFESRLGALSQAHEVLSRQQWTSGSLEQVVRDALKAGLEMERVTIDGADIAIGSKAVMAISMLLHELATNADKYGAMSNETGTVTIVWRLDDEALRLTWQEHGGPEVSEPESRGFGTRLIRRGLGLSGTSDLHFDPAGVRLELVVPLADLER